MKYNYIVLTFYHLYTLTNYSDSLKMSKICISKKIFK